MGDTVPFSGLVLLLEPPRMAGLLILGPPPDTPTSTLTNDALAQSLPTLMCGCVVHSFSRGSYFSTDDRGTFPSCPPIAKMHPSRTTVLSPLRGVVRGATDTHWFKLGMYFSTEQCFLVGLVSAPPITYTHPERVSTPGNFRETDIGAMRDQVLVEIL